MNICFGKFGRTVMFDKTKWSTIGGDNEAPTLLLSLARLHPEDTFYLISSSDFNKHTALVNRYPNIVSLFDGFNVNYDDSMYIVNKCKANNIKFDYAIIYNGITALNNVQGATYKNAKGEMANVKTLVFAYRYCANIVKVLNVMKPRWCLLTPDPRYYPMQAKDIFNAPDVIWSQYNTQANFTMRDYMTRDDSVYSVDMIYAEIETCFLIGKQKASLNAFTRPRTEAINIVLNEGGGSSGGIDRGPILKEYILDNFEDSEISNNIKIYGKWSDQWMSDERFQGCVRIESLFKILSNTKYTFIIPIQADWATAKFCEMSYYGIVPFMHKIYDTQKNIKCPEYCRVSSPQELRERIEYLESHEEKRLELLHEMYEMYDNDYYTGKKVIDTIYKEIAEHSYASTFVKTIKSKI